MGERIGIIGVPSQSGGRPVGVARGVGALRAAGLVHTLRASGHDVEDLGDVVLPLPDPARDPFSHVVDPDGLSALVRAVDAAVRSARARGAFPLVLGGDCPMLLGCLRAVRDVDGPLGLLHVDGHEDAYPPERSPTGDSADSEIAFALGHAPMSWDPELAAEQPWLAEDRLVLLGQRDRPDLERHGVASLADRCTLIDAAEVREDPASAAERALERLGSEPFWFHLDWDVLANEEMGAVIFPREGGLTWDDLDAVARAGLGRPTCAGWDAGTYNPDRDPDGTHATRIVGFLADALHALVPR
jgi:arginase